VFSWLIFLTVKLIGYRRAIIQLQKDMAGDGGILDELTKPHAPWGH
jgi:hypothetical protein